MILFAILGTFAGTIALGLGLAWTDPILLTLGGFTLGWTWAGAVFIYGGEDAT